MRISIDRTAWAQGSCVTLLLLGLLAGGAAAQGIKVSGPVIEIEPRTFNLGELQQKTMHRVRAHIRNAGTETLRISSVTSDCGCAVAQLPDSVLSPGDTTSVLITLSTRHYSGKITKHIYLKSNDPGAPSAPITLKALVRQIVTLRPLAVDFGTVLLGETPTRTLTVAAAQVERLEIASVVVPEEKLTTRITRSSRQDSTVFSVELTIRPDTPLGSLNSQANIHTNHERAKDLAFTVKGRVRSFFDVNPPKISFGRVGEGRGRQRTVNVTALREGSHRVLAVRCSHAQLDVTLTPVEEGRHYEITLTLPPDMPVGRIREKLRIETDDPHQPEIFLRVTGQVIAAREEGS